MAGGGGAPLLQHQVGVGEPPRPAPALLQLGRGRPALAILQLGRGRPALALALLKGAQQEGGARGQVGGGVTAVQQ